MTIFNLYTIREGERAKRVSPHTCPARRGDSWGHTPRRAVILGGNFRSENFMAINGPEDRCLWP